MTHALVNIGMTLSVLLFLTGYWFRRRNNKLHRILMTSGIAANLLSSVLLVVSVHLIYGGSMIDAGFVPAFGSNIVLAHRVVATVTAVLMILQAWSGATRRIELHRLLHYAFLPLYLGVYISGLIIFQSPETLP